MLARYYLRAFWRWLRPYKSFVLIIIAGTVYFILLRQIVAHRRVPSLVDSPRILLVKGSVLQWDRAPFSLSPTPAPRLFKPVAAAVVDVGGYRALTNSQGEYEVEFTSVSNHDIPIVIRINGQQLVERISFITGETRVRQDFIF
jgi:hypothetical protein